MSTTMVHMCQNVRGALRNIKQARHMVFHDNGRKCTLVEARDFFLDELSKGHEVIPIAECNNFDYKKGCQGHPVKAESGAPEIPTGHKGGGT